MMFSMQKLRWKEGYNDIQVQKWQKNVLGLHTEVKQMKKSKNG